MTQFDSIIRLRRDNDYNYEKVKDTFIPGNGEMCLVDTARNGLRAKIGDGVKTYAQLSFFDEDISVNVIEKGYLHEGSFYYEDSYDTVIEPSVNKIYLDLATRNMYCYNGTQYLKIAGDIATATSENSGIMKLYNETGSNTDGTMTQSSITDAIEKAGYKIDTDVPNQTIRFYKS